MAYNVLKGTVEFSGETNGKIENMVDTHSNQTVAGTKNFTGTVSASAFWDTTSNAAVPTPAVTAVGNGAQYRVATFGSTTSLNGEANLSFDASTLALTGNFTATSITGAAGGITNVPIDQFAGTIPASQLTLGNTLTGSTTLGVRSSGSIATGSNGVYLYIAPQGGFDQVGDGALRINPSTCLNITNGGQTLAGTDLMPVWDATAEDIRYTTLAYLYSNYLSSQVPQPSGLSGYVQLTNGSAFISDSALSFNTSTDTLSTSNITVTGLNSVTGSLNVTGSAAFSGSIQKNLRTVTSNYAATDADYTILVGGGGTKIITLPSPSGSNIGRVINVRKLYNVGIVRVSSSAGYVEEYERVNWLAGGKGAGTFQSDGNMWWMIHGSGSWTVTS
jgi:hypothetical protein